MRLRDSVEVALLLAVGYIIRLLVPPLMMGMKPDLLLAMLFVIIMMKRGNLKLCIQAGIVAGLITAMTTTFPGGQVPNIIDKLLTTLFVFGMVHVLSGRINDKLSAGIVTAVGTVFSGTVFLLSALVLVGLPGSFGLLVTSVVLPAAVVNTFAVLVLYPVVEFSRRTVVGRLHQAEVNTSNLG